jgi:hypothetical protein
MEKCQNCFIIPNMLGGISFWTDDLVWRRILTDLGAEFAPRGAADAVFAGGGKFSLLELKAEILRLRDSREALVIKKICKGAALTDSQKKIVIALSKAGERGLNSAELQEKFGYSAGAKTNAANTAIYQLRKIFGRRFIKNDGGRYRIVAASDKLRFAERSILIAPSKGVGNRKSELINL